MPVSAQPTTWRSVKSYFPGRHPGRYLLAVPDWKLFYVKNPKAACSTIVTWLDQLHTGESESPARIHQDHRVPTVAELGRDRMLSMLDGSAYRFSFVRHPLRRIESAYWDKVVYSRVWRQHALDLLEIKDAGDREVTFEEFLSAVERQDPLTEMDRHWRPQHLNLLHPLISFDHVGKLETFSADIARIRDEAGLPFLPAESRNISRRQRERSVFDGRPDLVSRVEQLYAQDFEVYDY